MNKVYIIQMQCIGFVYFQHYFPGVPDMAEWGMENYLSKGQDTNWQKVFQDIEFFKRLQNV